MEFNLFKILLFVGSGATVGFLFSNFRIGKGEQGAILWNIVIIISIPFIVGFIINSMVDNNIGFIGFIAYLIPFMLVLGLKDEEY